MRRDTRDMTTGKEERPVSETGTPQTAVEIEKLLSDPSFVSGMLSRSQAAHRWLDAHYEELAQRYPDQWAGADENGLAATAPSLTELIEALKNQGTDLKTAAICLLETDPPILIL